VWLPRHDILTFEEISHLTDVFAGVGVDRLRITGGEPLLRKDLPALIRLLSVKTPIRDLALTTNGMLLADQAAALRSAGLHRITISLDTLRPDRFKTLTRFDALDATLAGIDAALAAGFASVKLDAVVIRDVNDDEIPDLLEYGRGVGAEVRFIEYMDVGGATRWSPQAVITRRDILRRIETRYGPIQKVAEHSSAPAERFMLPDGTVFGIISSTTEPFCGSCDRSRLTADGVWYLCLYATHGIDLRGPLRAGASPDEMRGFITSAWERRDDRGAEQRLTAAERRPFIPLEELQKKPHLEMHTRGG
jgi:cyclic pyranopterin phosphate synthase